MCQRIEETSSRSQPANRLQRSKKGIIIFVFSFRLFVAVFSIASIYAYSKFFTTYARISIGIARTAALQEVLLATSLMTASIPCMRSFLDAFTSTGLMTVHGRNLVSYRPPGMSQSLATPRHTHGSRRQLPSQNRDKPSSSPSPQESTPSPSPNTPGPSKATLRPRLSNRHSTSFSRRLRPEGATYKANVHADDSALAVKKEGAAARLGRMPESFESLRGEGIAIQKDVTVRISRS